jgi:hypothetical protein
MADKADEKIKKLFAVVQAKKAEIEKLKNPTWVTNCNFEMHNGREINLHTVPTVEKLVEILATLLSTGKVYEEAAGELGVETEFKWGGYTIEEWKTDLITRKDKIQVADKKKKLAELERKLDALVSPEMKRELELQAIEDFLKED